MKTKTLSILLVTVLFGGLFLTAFSRVAFAYSPFGGQVIYRYHCECPIPGFLIGVSGPVGGQFLYSPGISQLFMNYNILGVGGWVLGMHTGTPVGCGHYSWGACSDQIPTRGIITMVGTS
jgi:hypothetical protein